MTIRHYLRLSAVSVVAMLAAGGVALAFPLSPPLVITSADQNIDLGNYHGDVYGGLDNFSTIDNSGTNAVFSGYSVSLIRNNAGGTITATTSSGTAVFVDADIGSFSNDGFISSEVNTAVYASGRIDTFVNTGSILETDTSNGAAVGAGDGFGSFTNAAGGDISGAGFGVYTEGDVTSFANAGTISAFGPWDDDNEVGALAAVYLGGDVGVFSNTGDIHNPDGNAGVIFGDPTLFASTTVGTTGGGTIGGFSNSGNISALEVGAAFGEVSVGSIANSGSISATGDAIGVGLLAVYSSVETLTNSGTLSGASGGLYAVSSDFGAIRNTGTMQSSAGTAAYLIETTADSFVNSSTGRIVGGEVGLGLVETTIASLVNDGYVSGAGTAGIAFEDSDTTLINAGIIEGDRGVAYDGTLPGRGDVINSGTIRGIGGTAIDFSYDPSCTCGGGGTLQHRNDTLTILTGSKIFGAVNFGRGDDTLDFSGFQGNTVLDVPGLNDVVAGSRNYVWDHDADQVAIYDVGAFGSSTIGSSFSQIAQAIAELSKTEMADWSDLTSDAAAPLNFAPQRPLTPAEQAVTDAGARSGPAPHGWAGVIGGGSVDYSPAEASTLYGGLVAGSHARLDAMLDLGGLGGLVQSSNSLLDGDETLDTTTGVAGLYGQARLGVADLDFALTGGASLHQSFRKIVAGGGAETATGNFGSVFAAPSATISIPVLANDGASLAFVGGGSYVGGLVSGYSETGSSMNLTVGSQTIGVVDARLGLEARQLISDTAGGAYALTAKAGVFADRNFGSSSVPVTLWGVSQSVATPGSTAYGAYGGFGVEAAMAGTMHLSAHFDGSARTDGVIAASAKAGIGGAF